MITDTGRMLEASLVIDCRGARTALPELAQSAGRVVTYESRPPPHPMVWGGYVSAAPMNRVLVGATHEKDSNPGDADEVAGRLLADLKDRLPDVASGLSGTPQHWSGIRATTPDCLPVCGAIPGLGFEDHWRVWARGGPLPEALQETPCGPAICLAGFGSRGFAHAPLLAEALASDLCGEPSPLERQGREIFHPARFAIRRLKRGG